MKKILFLLLVLIPLISCGQATHKNGVTVQDSLIAEGIAKFKAGMQIGDSITGSDIWTVDSLVFSATDTAIYINGNRIPLGLSAGEGGAGASTYLELTDTPGAYTPLYLIRVNAGGTALIFIDPATYAITNFLLVTTLGGYTISDTKANFNTALSDGSFAFDGGAFHDGFSDFVAQEHIRWDQTGGENIHEDRITELSVTQHEAAIDHDALTNYVAAEHIPWASSGAEDIHVDRIPSSSVPDTMINKTFVDTAEAFIQNLNGAVTRIDIDRQINANERSGTADFRKRLAFIQGGDSARVLGGIADSTDYVLHELRLEINGEIHFVDSSMLDTIYIDGTWASSSSPQYADFGWFTIKNLPSDSLYYGTDSMGNIQKEFYHNEIQYHYQANRSQGISDKTGGMLWRHDNWLNSFSTEQTALSTWIGLLDKYNVKATLGLNSWYEDRWVGYWDKHAKFWRSVQARGHEVADHGPSHTNYYYVVLPENRIATAAMPGVLRIGTSGTYDTVWCDTISDYASFGTPVLSNDGFDIMLKRADRIFKYAGLNKSTTWIEGGAQPVFYNPDSIYDASWLNGYIGGGKYNNSYYKHMGYNPPLDWIGKSEFFQDWNSTEAISLEVSGDAAGTRNYTAPEAVKKLVDQSAKHALTIFRQHVQLVLPDDWYLELMDSILNLSARYPHHIKNFTGTQAAREIYQSRTNPYLNYMPANPLTGQCFEDNIDSIYGDTMPDGWTIGADAAYWETGGSQGSKGFVSVGTGETTNLTLTRLYGIEKGTNLFTIDIRDQGANDTVYVEFTYYSGATYADLAGTEIQLAFPSPADWTIYAAEVTFPDSTSYVDMQIWSRTAVSYIDEITLRKFSLPESLIDHDALLNYEAGEHVVYNSGSGITIDGSNNIDLGGTLDQPTTITGTEVNDFNISITDAGDRSGILGFDADNWWLSMRAYTGDDHTGDSSILAVDSTIVTIAQYDGAAVKSIVIDTNSFVITDTDNGKGPVMAADYSTVTTARSITDKEWQGTHLGYQILNSSVYSPTPSEHGDLITWDSLNLEYVATDVVPVAQAAGLVIESFDTIIFSITIVDTIIILPVGAVIWDIQVYLNTTFDGSGTNLLDVGIDGDGDKYINDFDLENPTATFYGLGATPDRMAATTEIIFQYTDSGADASAGLAFIYVKYSIPAKLY